jgi:hypothetical protein
MKKLVTRMLIAAFGLTLATAPLAASADDWHHDGWHRAPAYGWHYDDWHRDRAWHAGYWHGGVWHGGYWGPPRYVEGYYGWAPGGFYGYYHAGHWFAHRRWGSGFWIYF